MFWIFSKDSPIGIINTYKSCFNELKFWEVSGNSNTNICCLSHEEPKFLPGSPNWQGDLRPLFVWNFQSDKIFFEFPDPTLLCAKSSTWHLWNAFTNSSLQLLLPPYSLPVVSTFPFFAQFQKCKTRQCQKFRKYYAKYQ